MALLTCGYRGRAALSALSQLTLSRDYETCSSGHPEGRAFDRAFLVMIAVGGFHVFRN